MYSATVFGSAGNASRPIVAVKPRKSRQSLA